MIKSVKKSCYILKYLSNVYPEGARLEAIASETKINKSTCAHILATLIDEQLVERTSHAVYRLGAGCFHLTRSGRFDGDRVSVCRPVLRWLHNKSNQTVLIAEVRSCQKYVVDYIQGELTLSAKPADIIEDSLYRTATGRLIMSRMSRSEIFDIIYKNGLPQSPEWYDFNSVDEVCEYLSEIRKAEFVYSGLNTHYGIAAEIKDKNGVVGAVGIAIICNDGDDKAKEILDSYKKDLSRAAKEMTRRLTFDM